MIKLTIIFLAISLYATRAAVIRPTEEMKDLLETTTALPWDSLTTLEPETTTVNEEDFTTTTTERSGGLSRDEEASILVIDQTLSNSAPSELIKTEVESVQVEKFGKLLLLSTPKIAEKPKQLEENLEESEEQDDTVQNVTEFIAETTVMSTEKEETTTVSVEEQDTKDDEKKIEDDIKTEDNKKSKDDLISTDDIKPEDNFNSKENVFLKDIKKSESTFDDLTVTTEKTTKLYPINDTLYEDNKMTSSTTAETPSLVVDEQPKELLNSHLASIVLEESEADYVLVDSEILEGSYTDADSELHLQPIVQSVEIVPSSLDDPLLINYVHSW